MSSTEELTRLEYAALMNRVQEAERMSFLCWMVGGIAGTALLTWGIGSGQPGLMVPVVLVSGWGFMALARWREQAMLIAGYLETHYESADRAPAFFTRQSRMQTVEWDGAGREWHPTVFFNALAAVAAVFAWTMASAARHGELWAGVVTGCTLGLVTWSISETARLRHTDAASLWERSQGGLREVKRRASSR